MNRLLIVRLSSLGDIIHTIPLAAALREAFPTSRIDWLVERRYAEVLEIVSSLDRIWSVELSSSGGLLKSTYTMRSVRKMKYDCAIDGQGLMKSALIARASAARTIIGFGKGAAREAAATVFYTDTCLPPGNTHRIQKNLFLLQVLGIRAAPAHFPLTFREKPSASNLCNGEQFVLMIPTAGWSNKQWPPERFGLLAKRIQEMYSLPSIIDRGAGDGKMALAVADASGGSAVVAPHMSIIGLFKAIRKATLVVSVDTGPLHMAASVGTPVVGIYGPTDPRQSGPWSAEDETVSRYDECHCPYNRRCHAASRCIDRIGDDEVLQAVDRRLQSIRLLVSERKG